MATKTIGQSNFKDTVEADGIVLIDFWAEWCGPCRNFGPVFEAASETHPDINFVKIDTEAEQELAGALQVMSIPTLMAFRDGILLYREAGALPAPMLEELIGKIRELDMDDVRRQISDEAAQEDGAESATN